MKKIFLLFFTLFLLTGCYDYSELNDLSVVTMITIDKNNNDYIINFEIINDLNQNDNNTNKSIFISGSGKTLASAIKNTASKTPKQTYLAHLKVLLISKEIASNDLKEVIEYFLRAPEIRNEFFIAISDNNIDDIKSINQNRYPIISDYIFSLIKNNKKSFNNITDDNFEDIIINIAKKGKDATIPVISFNNNYIEAKGTAILNDYKLKTILFDNNSSLLNILLSKSANTLFTYDCLNGDKEIALSIYSGKTDIRIDRRLVLIDSNLMAKINEYNCDDNLKDVNTFKKYNNYYADIIKIDLLNLYDTLKSNNTDVLGIDRMIYIKKRKYQNDAWLNYDIKVNVDLKINKEGLIFEVNNGN